MVGGNRRGERGMVVGGRHIGRNWRGQYDATFSFHSVGIDCPFFEFFFVFQNRKRFFSTI